MSNTTISWNNNTPADTDLVGQGDDTIRSLKSNLQGALDAEHFFPSAGGAAGAHRKGSARVFVGASSEVSSADTDGRLMFNSSISQLVYLNSTASVVVGGRMAMQGVPGGGFFGTTGLPLTQYIAVDGGTQSNLTSGNTVSVSFNATFAAAPVVQVSLSNPMGDAGGTRYYAPAVGNISASGFDVLWAGVDGGASYSTASIAWMAFGRRAYP